MAPGTSVKLGVIHDGQEKTVTLTLGTLPNEKARPPNQQKRARGPIATCRSSASRWRPAQGRIGGSGVVVTAVDPNGVAADHGFQVGDVILDVGGKSVASPSDVRKQLADARKEGKHTLLFRVKSGAGHTLRRASARQRLSK